MILLKFEILGNHEDPLGNPIPYTRTTARSKYRLTTKTGKPTQYSRYCSYRAHIRRSLSREDERHLIQEIWPLIAAEHYQFFLDCQIQFKGTRYGDVDNIVKGLLDALFPPKRKKGPDDRLIRGRPVTVRDGQDCGWIKCVLLGPFPRDEWPNVPICIYEELDAHGSWPKDS